MGKFLFCIVAAVASLVLVDSLSCNTCSLSVVGVCLNMGNETCSENVTDCFTQTLSFPGIPSFAGFSRQGCKSNTTICGTTFNDTLIGATYEISTSCCGSDFCNTITTSSSPTTKMTFSAAICGAMLASMLGTIF